MARGDAPALSLRPAALLAACGSGDGFVGSGGAGGPLAPNFDSIQANIFEPLCEHCHSGANAPVGLRLDAANSYALLVGVASVERPNMLRVAPGDPNNSYLIQKLEGTAARRRAHAGRPAGVAASRHQHHSAVDHRRRAAELVDVRTDPRHVAVAGAELDGARAAGLDHGRLQPRAQRAVRHDGDVHAATRGTDGVLGTADDVAITPASVTVPAANPRSAVMDLTGVASVFDRYRITLVGTGPAAILDLSGNALDGEPIRLLPSGDGTRRRRLHGDVHGRRNVADADVDPDERVHAALRGLSHGRRHEPCPAR